MKELTIEKKAQRYDEAIEVARKINSGEGVAAPSDWTTCEVIFPELKESKDEKIRKELIRAFKSINTIKVWNGIERTDILAWLEQQGEQPTAWNEEDEDYTNDLIKYFSQNERLKNTKEDIVFWLKSLRMQNRWKPSDAQMDSIACAVRKMKESACYDSELVSLHQDLKKLKEE